MAVQLVFGRLSAQAKDKLRQGQPEVKVVYFRSPFKAQVDDDRAVLPSAEQPVQFAMSAAPPGEDGVRERQ